MPSQEIQKIVRLAVPKPGRTVVWLLDVDDTLTNTKAMHHRAAEALTSSIAKHMAEPLAIAVSDRFRQVFDELLLVHQQSPISGNGKLHALEELESRVRQYQSKIFEKWQFNRLFSREILLRIAIEDCGASLSPDDLHRCANQYWDHMQKNPLVFPDAIRLSQRLASQGTPTYLMTSSDARYRERAIGEFTYNPRESRSDKRHRMLNLKKHGINYSKAFIGDPIDKPSEEFYNLVFTWISEDLRQPLKSLFIVVAGDSYRSDIQTPIELLQSSIGILCRRGQPTIKAESDRVLSISDFDILTKTIDLAGDDSKK
ncbi:hypothetical protein ACFV2I_16035 [Streptomyces microflavus]|uniref:hypothetical protein n=1 Tax=Streptomyces microflavus TaxID=1919 RepID=UPI0036AC593A